MIAIPEEFSLQISEFSCLFRKKVFEHAKILLLGSILVIGRRTVSSALRVLGFSSERRYHKYHRVLSLSKWSAYKAARILLLQLVQKFSSTAEPLIFGIDETIERRWGKKISARAIYRDSVRSSESHTVKCSGLRWICLMLLSPISWAERIWALPFLTVLAPSERYHEQNGKRHKKITDWARQMILQLSRWLPNRKLIIVGDSAYATYRLLDAVRQHVCVIATLRLDARLFDEPPVQPSSKRGPKPQIGQRQPTLLQRLKDTKTQWQKVVIPNWYGQIDKVMYIATGTARWYKSSEPLVPLRWVLLKDPEGKIESRALLCTDLEIDAIDVINYFIRRWTVEVTFEEARTHLGLESQRQWSDLAIARTTPVLMALFSIITLWANQLNQQGLINLQISAWYQKSHPTFSDAIAAARKQIWRNQKYLTSHFKGEVKYLNQPFVDHLINLVSRAA